MCGSDGGAGRVAVALLLLTATACGGSEEESAAAPRRPQDAAGASDLGTTDGGPAGPDLGRRGDVADADVPPADGAGVADQGPCPDMGPPAPLFEASACDRACDRVCDCSVDECQGFTWASVGALGAGCYELCDGGFEVEVLAAASCEQVQTQMTARDPSYGETCSSDVCQQSCLRLGRCVVAECPALSPPFDEQVAADCAVDCATRSPEETDWLLNVPCSEMVEVFSGDEGFVQACTGEESVCPEPERCALWSAKLAACMRVHCGEPIEAWIDGIEQAVASYCSGASDCPSPQEIEGVLPEEVGCEHPALAETGPAPPFTEMCRGTTPASAAQTVAVCEDMLRCPGLEVLDNPQVCSVQLALLPDMRQRVDCLATADGDCPAIFGCLEGM